MLRGNLAGVGVMALLLGAGPSRVDSELLWQHRNLGKAYYENPATQLQAAGEFRKALELAPDSARERLNYGLALLRAGQTTEGIAELEKAQTQDPKLPHTWFNLAIAYKKSGEYERAAAQFAQMVRLVPDEPVSHYNLGVLHKMAGRTAEAIAEFETAERLNPNLGAPHFQLYNAYRQAGRTADAARELQVFQEIRKRNEDAPNREDMEWSYYAEIYDPLEAKPYQPLAAEPAGAARKIAGGFAPGPAGLAVLDFDGDGRPGLIAWSADNVRLFRNGSTPVADTGLADLKGVVSIAPGDFDNDGLADLCVVTKTGALLYHNEKGRFRRIPARLPAGRFAKAVWLDYDHDYDLDLFLLGDDAALARNNGAAGFSDETARFPFVKGQALDAAPFDLVADTDGFDLVVSYKDRAGVLYRDRLAAKYEAVPVDLLPAGARFLAARDLDHDGWTDLAAGTAQAVEVLLNRHGTFERAGVAPAAFPPVVCDFDGNGHAEEAFIGNDGGLYRRSAGPPPVNWLRVTLAGVKNLKLGYGSKVEVKAGSHYEKRTYSGAPLLFDMGAHKAADTVRITWPNGLIQNEPKQALNRAVVYKEAPRLSGSCPMIFTWNGRTFEFLTDVLGVAPLGASVGDGRYFPVDHDEYVQIAGERLQPRGGRYEIRITEELREVSYLDQVRLIAVDHPSGVEIFTNDKFKAPPFPEFRLFGARRRVYPRAASVPLERLLRRDGVYAEGFHHDAAGVAELHHLDLDFGRAAPDNRAVLILNGWVDWADGSTFLNASQQHRDLVLPRLQVKDRAGQWRTVVEDLGIPAGKPKTIAVDLSGKFLSASREVRIITNLCVYWDEIFLSEDADPPPARLTVLDAESADLRFRGFSRPVGPVSFDYDRISPVSMWNPTPGYYTRYGDVRPLLREADDRMVILGSGDELRLAFPAGGLPPLPAGWKRDFLLLVDGWAKDGDANTAFSRSVDPLPFHAMSQYPYRNGEHFPDDEGHRQYLRHYNTRPASRLLPALVPSAALR